MTENLIEGLIIFGPILVVAGIWFFLNWWMSRRDD